MTSEEVCAFLKDKFSANTKVPYHVVEIEEELLQLEQERASHKVYQTVVGTNSFQVMVFKPNSTTFRAAPRLCMCLSCVEDYGSCALFDDYSIKYSHVGNVVARSTVLPPDVPESGATGTDFVFPDTYVAVISQTGDEGQMRGDKFWLIHVVEVNLVAEENMTDSYNHTIHEGYSYISGHFLERLHDGKNSTIYKEDERVTFFYKENVVYPYVQLDTKLYKGHPCLELQNTEKLFILNFMDQHGCTHVD